jgi:hypothetical protein
MLKLYSFPRHPVKFSRERYQVNVQAQVGNSHRDQSRFRFGSVRPSLKEVTLIFPPQYSNSPPSSELEVGFQPNPNNRLLATAFAICTPTSRSRFSVLVLLTLRQHPRGVGERATIVYQVVRGFGERLYVQRVPQILYRLKDPVPPMSMSMRCPMEN